MVVEQIPSQEQRASLARAYAARLLVAITFHFDVRRLGYLAEVLRSLAEYPVVSMEVVIVTNAYEPDDIALLHRLGEATMLDSYCHIRSERDLTHPHNLAWCHKEIIAREMVAQNCGRFSHFIYLEDDIRLSFVNFCYFVEFRDALRSFGLLPGFVRVELSSTCDGYVCSDAFWPIYVPNQAYVRIGDNALVNMPNPYNPCFILDGDLAAEYVKSPSFEPDASLTVCRWGVRERASMGLCLENVPTPFASRYVIPVSVRTGMAATVAWISHLPNTYANNPHSPLARIRMHQLFAGMADLSSGNTPNQFAAFDNKVTVDKSSADPACPPSFDEQDPDYESKDYYHLVSHFDTILYLDLATQKLRHGPLGIVPLNLAMKSIGQDARLIEFSNGGPRQLVTAERAAELGEQPTCGSPDWRIDFFNDDSIGVHGADRYLGAEWGGVVGAREWCRAWERFRLVRADTLAGLNLLKRHTWVSCSDRRIVSLVDQPIDFGRDHPDEASAIAATLAPGALMFRRNIVFGPVRLRLLDNGRAIVFRSAKHPGQGDIELARPEQSTPTAVRISDSAGEWHEFLRFDPLVHFWVRGDDVAYERLLPSLASLGKCGHFTGPVGVTCDRSTEDLLKYIPQEWRHRLVTSTPTKKSDETSDYNLANRFQDTFQPILCCSPGATFEADIMELLIDAVLSGKSWTSSIFR